jgi:rubrerythrin
MNELAVYIVNYYHHLMTAEERAAHSSILAESKIEHDNSPSMKETLQGHVSTDPKVRALLADGKEAFFARVRDRVLRDHPNEVFLNQCPRCGALAKTPTAKQCPKCFFSWHGDV